MQQQAAFENTLSHYISSKPFHMYKLQATLCEYIVRFEYIGNQVNDIVTKIITKVIISKQIVKVKEEFLDFFSHLKHHTCTKSHVHM